jgi:glycosyltransferase involved in cell wall biosynthesis
MKKLRVAILHNIVAPYRFPLFNALAKQDLDLTVLFLAAGAKNRKWDLSQYRQQIKFTYKVLPNFRLVLPLKDYTEYIINPTIFFELQKYDLVITAGWLDFSCQMTYILKKFYGYRCILWSESTQYETSWQRSLTLPFVRWIVGMADTYIAIGKRSREYLVKLGANSKEVFTAISTVDVAHFAKESRLKEQARQHLKQKLGIPKNNKVLLYVGQFIERKNVKVLFKALELLPKNFTLLLVGYGPLEESYREYAATHRQTSICIVPHQEVNYLPHYYGIADVFVLPSLEETWGLVVNEAAAAGLPVIVSDTAGSAGDLVVPGKNGFTFDPKDVRALVAAVQACTANSERQKEMSEYSRKIIKNCTPEKAAASFYTAISAAIRG